MGMSANSIIHYTNSIDVLKSILKEGFKIKYCVEKLVTQNGKQFYRAFPMVCFCDIPLSDAWKYVESYGGFGIGLSKKWAFANNLNPVLYIEVNSTIGKRLKVHALQLENAEYEMDDDFMIDFLTILSHSKNYQSKLTRNNGDVIEDYIFYNEREWRYVPSMQELESVEAKLGIYANSYLRNKGKYNDLLDSLRLEFDPEDISHIIVRKNKEIPEIIEYIRSIYKRKCTSEDLDITLTKVKSIEQIKDDF
jgi:hypothetical protein